MRTMFVALAVCAAFECAAATAAPAQKLPDLAVTASSWSTDNGLSWTTGHVQTGQNVLFRATIRNQGRANVPSGTQIRVDFRINGTAVSWGTYNGGLSRNVQVTITANTGPDGDSYWNNVQAGSYAQTAVADPLGTITESNENNNTLSGTLVVDPVGPPPGVMAFPTCEGFGCNATGGRGGVVMFVTNTSDSGTGSLRACMQASGPRTCVFRTGGTVTLLSPIQVFNNNLTVAGQTAPGGGFQVKSSNTYNDDTILISAGDVIIRYLRVRTGPTTELTCCRDPIVIVQGNDIALDHLSLNWSVDELLSAWADVGQINRVTVQWSIIAEALKNDGHFNDAGTGPGPHADGPLFGRGTSNVSFHHNLIASNTERNPKCDMASGVWDMRNNVIENWGPWGGSSCEANEGAYSANFVSNYYRPGPNTPPTSDGSRYEIASDVPTFLSGNVTQVPIRGAGPFVGTPFAAPAVTTTSATQALTDVLAGAGATLPSRDASDARIVTYVTNSGGLIIDDPSQVGGWPTLAAGTAPTDTDSDGMPDAWETANGTNPNVADNNGDLDADGYTNLEEYLNSL